MCVPGLMAAASFAMSALGGIMQYSAQMQQYENQKRLYEENADNARRAAINKWEALNVRTQQEGAVANQKKFEANIETAKSVATAQVAAGEGGVSGLSVNALTRDFYARQGRYNAAVDSNLRMTRGYLKAESKAEEFAAQDRINSVPIPEKPSFAATLVGIFGSGIDAFGSYKQATS